MGDGPLYQIFPQVSYRTTDVSLTKTYWYLKTDLKFKILNNNLFNNYSPRWRWLVVEIYRAAYILKQ